MLQVTRHSDVSVVAHVFTERFGCVPFVARRPRCGRGGGVASALLQPLSQLTLECSRPGGVMQRLVGAELGPAYVSIPFVPAKSAVAMFLSEFLWKALRREEPSAGLYEFVALSLQWFDEAEEGYANFHIIFLLQLTRYLGYDPTMLPEAREYDIATLMRHNYRSMRLIPLNGEQRSGFLERLVGFYGEMMPEMGEVKSLGVLGGMFREASSPPPTPPEMGGGKPPSDSPRSGGRDWV